MINILEFIFLSLALAVTFTGILISKYEKHVPAFIIKGYKYGSFAYQGSGGNFLEAIEISKAYYRHFYLFSSILSVATLGYMILVYFLGFGVNRFVAAILRLILEQDVPSVSATAALVAMSLLAVQCARRFYETYCLQVFAKSSKMNLSHYLSGIIHYFGCIVTVIGQAPLFLGNQSRDSIAWNDTYTTLISIPCSIIFLWCWYEQYQSNVIFANLRKDKKSGKVVTEDHKIPHGRWFERVSSPHRMLELIMYTILVVLIPTRTFFCIYLWVLSNQIQTAQQAHDWYKKTFKDYPSNRKAIIPGVL
ncbi:polyprenol reductase [Pectinophora gossypiella]|uniref:polyprenol reductase n=1 Tax=Pectinophora gossypiella TaxID=13191 RepID=UPI00214E3349|nr:polyprenol reductase [Pectinophora gossypiella]